MKKMKTDSIGEIDLQTIPFGLPKKNQMTKLRQKTNNQKSTHKAVIAAPWGSGISYWLPGKHSKGKKA